MGPVHPPNPGGRTTATAVEAKSAGNICKIERSPRDGVDEGEVIRITESMKLEISLEAPCSRRLAELSLVEDDGIEQGAILAVIE